MGEDIMENEF